MIILHELFTEVECMDLLTTVILTKNEEKNIIDVVCNCKQLTSNVLIVDSGSTDKTVELAKQNGAKVVNREWDNDFSAQRNFALEHVDTDWVLYLDADERLDEMLISEIKVVLESGAPAMYRFIRQNSAFGRDFKYGVLGPDSVTRLFPKDKVRWQDKVHERPVGDLPVVTLKGYLKHYTYRSFEQYVQKMNQYSSIGAQNYHDKHKKVSILGDFILRPFFAFFKMYIIKRGFLEGWLGFVLCLNYTNYTLNKYVKLKLLNKEKENA